MLLKLKNFYNWKTFTIESFSQKDWKKLNNDSKKWVLIQWSNWQIVNSDEQSIDQTSNNNELFEERQKKIFANKRSKQTKIDENQIDFKTDVIIAINDAMMRLMMQMLLSICWKQNHEKKMFY